MAERGWRLQRWTCSLLASDGKSCRLVAFPKLAMAGFQEVKKQQVFFYCHETPYTLCCGKAVVDTCLSIEPLSSFKYKIQHHFKILSYCAQTMRGVISVSSGLSQMFMKIIA